MMSLFSIETIAFTLLGYPLSYLELVATSFGVLSVCLAARANILNWPAGIINECAFFLLFFQINLYADMFLQCVFFVMTLYGWYMWRKPQTALAIHYAGRMQFFRIIAIIIVLASLCGVVIGNIHNYFPAVFPEPAAHPFVDSLVAVLSIAALGLMTRKCVEAWILWIAIDILSVGLFIATEVYLVAIQFFIFLLMASYGYYHWSKQVVR